VLSDDRQTVLPNIWFLFTMQLKKLVSKLIIIFLLSFILVYQSSNTFGTANQGALTDSQEAISFYSQVLPENQDTQPNKAKHLIFAYSADATPISSQDGAGSDEIDKGTFCGQILEKLEAAQKSTDTPYLHEYTIKKVWLDSSQRFRGLIEHPTVAEIAGKNNDDSDHSKREQSREDQLNKEVEREKNAKAFFVNNMGIECGPNSITPSRVKSLANFNGTFSDKFYTTGTKILIHKDARLNLYKSDFFSDHNRKDNIIGVVGGQREKDNKNSSGCPPDDISNDQGSKTTTGGSVQSIYGSKVKTLVLRSQAKACLNNKEKPIIAYSSDEILLRGMLERFPSDLNDYVIEPPNSPLTHEEYGIVVYGEAKSRGELVQRINGWSNLLKAGFFETKEKELPIYSSQEKNFLFKRIGLPTELFFRSHMPSFLLKANQLKITALSLFAFIISFLILTHGWVAIPIAKLFPCLFRAPIGFIERLRAKGFEHNNKILQLITEMLRNPERILRETYNKSQGIGRGVIDSVDVVQVLEVQVKFAKQFRPNPNMLNEEVANKEEEIANKIAEQIKSDPYAREVITELTRLLGTSWANTFGEQVGQESANQFMNLLSKIAEQVYNSDA
jgi:hypothetical protein